MTPFEEASLSVMSVPILRLILALIAEHLQQWGELPSVDELQRKLQQPGL